MVAILELSTLLSIDRDSSSTSYGTCESDLEDIEIRGFDDVALFQTFARFMGIWNGRRLKDNMSMNLH